MVLVVNVVIIVHIGFLTGCCLGYRRKLASLIHWRKLRHALRIDVLGHPIRTHPSCHHCVSTTSNSSSAVGVVGVLVALFALGIRRWLVESLVVEDEGIVLVLKVLLALSILIVPSVSQITRLESLLLLHLPHVSFVVIFHHLLLPEVLRVPIQCVRHRLVNWAVKSLY